MGDNAILLDTNVLVYAELSNSPFHDRARKKLEALHTTAHTFWINRRIIREYLVTMTRAYGGPKNLAASEAVAGLDKVLQQVSIANENAQVTDQLLHLVREHSVTGKQIHDANVVASMMVYKIPRLLTHNVSDFDRFSSIIDLIPLL